MSSFPRTLADLKAGDDPLLSSHGFYSSLKELRKSTLSIPNRLRSILKDAEFVQEVAAAYTLPVVANERCGSWYIHPDMKAGSAYFKSTDGHTGQWSFSLRRLNLQMLDIIGRYGGCIIVDSTRRGKVMPDAFSKTVPIWCAVMNRALFPEQRQFHHFQLPAVGLPASEVAQIEIKLDGFVRAFRDLGVDREALRQKLGRPMKLRWVLGHSTDALPADGRGVADYNDSCHTVILCSVSRRVKGAEMSEGGYIQGAGDDSEGWSHGMTPRVFWSHQDMLFQSQEEELPELIEKLLSVEGHLPKPHRAALVEPTNNLYIAGWTGHDKPQDFDLIINCHSHESDKYDGAEQLDLQCDSRKLGSRGLRQKLNDVHSYAASTLKRHPACRILITCDTGKDLSVGVALMLLCLFYSDEGRCVYQNHDTAVSALDSSTTSPNGLQQGQKIDKGFIKRRLVWITTSKADANPSRSTLQSVNTFLMNRP
jgi:tRNA A64-2'-O-ribosylphosphate transferase